MKKRFFLILLFCSSLTFAQEQLTIRNIFIEGIKTTKESTVLRELSFSAGDTINSESLQGILAENRNNLLNQWLFNFVDFTPLRHGNEVDIILKVTERWYVWPYPVFEISERNFNVFWDSLRHSGFEDFSRLNYGVFLNWYNFRGRNELLKIKVRKGYREHYLFECDIPYLNKAKTWGAIFTTELFRMEKFHYQTINNQLLYTNTGDELFNDRKISFALQHKPGIYSNHKIELEGTQMQTTDGVTSLNPHYFPTQDNTFNYLRLSYHFTQEKRDNKEYPLDGNFRELYVEFHQGAHNNYQNLSIIAKTEQHKKFHPRWSIGNSIKAKVSAKKTVPYVLNRALGFEDYLRGYEYYVIDGSHFALSKTALKWAAIPTREVHLPLIPWEQFNKTHFSVYFSIFADMGYAYDHQWAAQNSLNNEFLMSQGISIDIVTYYDKLFRLECSRNHLGETGFFIHFSNPF